ncbi:MAG: hypothetical protein D6788_07280 [Planctomycetota bacterium]|nr:MAG: hypothetical protein D6788_07280 [Planctomycetota bacterium]
MTTILDSITHQDRHRTPGRTEQRRIRLGGIGVPLSVLLSLILALSPTFAQETTDPAEGGDGRNTTEEAGTVRPPARPGTAISAQETTDPAEALDGLRSAGTEAPQPVARAAAGDAPLLFAPRELPPGVLARTDPAIVRFRPVEVDLDTLSRIEPGKPMRMTFNLFDDVSVPVSLENRGTRGPMQFSLFGRPEGFPQGSVYAVVENTVMVGSVNLPGRGYYRIRVWPGGIQVVELVDPTAFPPCGVTQKHVIRAPAGQAANAPPKNDFPKWETDGEPSSPQGSSTIDVLVLYTPSARDAAGGRDAINALCQLAVDQANGIYDNSGIIHNMRLVWRRSISYTESGTHDTDLDRLTATNDGFLDLAHTYRDQVDADVVTLLINDSSACGLGWVMGSVSNSFKTRAFNTVHWDCADGPQWSMTHEIGHNQGCAHDRDNAGVDGVYSYSYGYRFRGNSGSTWRTIMAYSPGTRIEYFSNPNKTYDGKAAGIAVGQTGEAYNARTINNTGDTMAGFRSRSSLVWVDFSYFGLEAGTQLLPYNTLIEGVNNVAGLGTVRIRTGSSPETISIIQPLTIDVSGGPVTIGN